MLQRLDSEYKWKNAHIIIDNLIYTIYNAIHVSQKTSENLNR